MLKSFEIAKSEKEEIIFFVEDDYIHSKSMIEEMILSYQRIASQLDRDIFMFPTDYPYLYMDNEISNILIVSIILCRHVIKRLCKFMTSRL